MNLENKYKKLSLGLVFDAIGYVSFVVPMLDVVWAPASAYLMTKMYKGKEGKVAAAISFVEEALPFLDVIPTFTLMWIYVYIIKVTKIKKMIEI